MYAIFDRKRTFQARVKRFIAVVSLYAATSLIYLIATRLLISVYFHQIHKSINDVLPQGSPYRLEISPFNGQLVDKAKALWVYFFHRMPVTAFQELAHRLRNMR